MTSDKDRDKLFKALNVLFYRPQRSWGKVMFLHVCVILFTGGWCYPSMHCRWYPSMPCSRSPGRGACSWGGSAPKGGSAPGGSAPRGAWWRPPLGQLLRAVHILLECILVWTAEAWNFMFSTHTYILMISRSSLSTKFYMYVIKLYKKIQKVLHLDKVWTE